MSTPTSVKSFTTDWSSLFDSYGTAPVRGGRLIRGHLRPGLRPTDPAVSELLRRWPGSHAVRESEAGAELILFAPEGVTRERWWLHALLFALTAASVLLAGSLLAGRDPLALRGWPHEPAGPLRLPVWLSVDWGALAAGWPFAVLLLAILLAHEMGHYVAARRHRIPVTPPFFIPFPAYVSIVGTLGAFIRLRAPVLGRRALLDVGVAGPLAGFVLSAAATVFGLLGSPVWLGAAGDPPAPYVLSFLGVEIWVGGSLLFNAAAALWLGDGFGVAPIVLSPIACAGWFGFFVTALNLLPIGQLDGGHIVYALAPNAQRWVSRASLLLLLPLGFAWPGWWVWAALVFFVGRGRLAHPPVFDLGTPLDPRRRALAWVGLVVLALTFVPRPFVL